MTKSEMRFIRREIINHTLHSYPFGTSIRIIITRVQIRELLDYGYELKAYA